jgi:hypothetical protein
MRSEALDLASQLLVSPEELVVRCRGLLRLLLALGIDLDRHDLLIFRAVDSEADSWPVGVDAERLDSDYHRRCLDEMRDYSQAVWVEVCRGCRTVQALLSRPNKP